MVWSWDAWLRMSHKTLTKNPQMFGFFLGPRSTSVGQSFAPFPTYVSLGDDVGCVTCFLADFSTKDISHFLIWPKLMCPSLRPAGLLSFLYGRKGSPQWSTSPKTLSGVRHVHFDDGKPDRFFSFSDTHSAGGSNSAEMGTKVTDSEPKVGSVHSFQFGTWTLICTPLFIGHLKEFHVVKKLFVLKKRIN